MHADRMAEIQDGMFQKIISIRQTKGREYATDEDTLADFKEVAEEAGITPLQCWATYVKKHERAIDTYIREGAVKSESIEGRILDVIVYHILLLGLIEDLDGPTGPVGVALHHAKAGETVAIVPGNDNTLQCSSMHPRAAAVRCANIEGHTDPHRGAGRVW